MSDHIDYTPQGRAWEPVRLDMTLANETWIVSDPMRRDIAERALRLIGEQGTPVNGKHVRSAIIVPIQGDELLALVPPTGAVA